MNSNVIQFACGHCQSWLTVPAQMAGVAGPCPRCGNHIVSPAATAPPPAPIAPPAASWPPADPGIAAHQPSGAPVWPGAGLHPAQQQMPMGRPPSGPMQAPAPQMYPPAPEAAPLMAPPPNAMPWGQPPPHPQQPPAAHETGPAALPGGYPMQNQGVRPNAGLPPPVGHRGPPLPPPAAPYNPIANAMGQMPGGIPQAGDQGGSPGMLTRPASVGGSRLSLLARQLTTTTDGTPGLPVAPAPLSTSELPGQAPMTFAAPDGSRNQQAGAMMLKQNMRRGLGVHPAPSRGRGKFALVAIMLLGLLGALVWQYRAPLKDIIAQVLPPKPALPEPSAPPSTAPVPGVDKMTLPTAEPVTRTPTVVSRPDTPPPTEEVKDVKPMTEPGPKSTEPAVSSPSMSGNPGAVPQQAVPPRAIAVVDDPPADVEVRSAKTAEPPAPINPLVASTQQKMVEVGRASGEPKIAQSIPPPPTPMLAPGQPSVKNVPPVCKPALDGLLSFLNARNWRERLKYSQLPNQMEEKLKMYYASNPDGPVDVDEIHYLRHDEDPQVGKGLHAVFVLFSRNWEFGFPIMVEVTPDGARVDWLTFIEFKDDMLNKFLSHYMEERVQFHVGIHRTHYFDDNIPGLDQKEQFAISSPMDNVRGFVFVPKGTPFARSLASTISWDKEASWVVVELQWRKEGNAKWVEMTALPQLNWYTSATAAAPVAERPPPAPIGSKAK